MALAQLEFTLDDFSKLFTDFITMCLEHYPHPLNSLKPCSHNRRVIFNLIL